MNIYVNTRSSDKDYVTWLSSKGKINYSEKWLEVYKNYFMPEKPSLIFQRETNIIKCFITDIPSDRKDNSKTSIRYSLAFDVNYNETENRRNIENIIKAWLYERFNANDKGKIINSSIGTYLDSVFKKEYIDKLLSSETSEISDFIEISDLVKSCKEEADYIDYNDDFKENNLNGYYICNLRNRDNTIENLNIFYSLISNILNQKNIVETQTCAFFSLITKLKTVEKIINTNKNFPKILCIDIANFDSDEIDCDTIAKENINESCICLKKKLQKAVENQNPLQFQEKPIQSKNIRTKEIENSKKSNTIKIIVMALLISIGTNIGTTMKLISQNKQMTVLTTKIQKLEYDKTEVEKINRELEQTIQETQSKLTKMEHINQEKVEQLKTLTTLKEENQKLKQQLQNYQKKEIQE